MFITLEDSNPKHHLQNSGPVPLKPM